MPDFETRMRGYDPTQVDAYIQEQNNRLAAQQQETENLRANMQHTKDECRERLEAYSRQNEQIKRLSDERVEQLEQQLKDLQAKNTELQKAANNAFLTIGETGQQLINRSKTMADEIRTKAEAEAKQILDKTHKTADELVTSSKAEAERILTAAKTEAKTLREKADEESKTLLEQARSVAAAEQEKADNARRQVQESIARLDQARSIIVGNSSTTWRKPGENTPSIPTPKQEPMETARQSHPAGKNVPTPRRQAPDAAKSPTSTIHG